METPREQLRKELNQFLINIKAKMFELYEQQVAVQNQINVLDSLDKLEKANKSEKV